MLIDLPADALYHLIILSRLQPLPGNDSVHRQPRPRQPHCTHNSLHPSHNDGIDLGRACNEQIDVPAYTKYDRIHLIPRASYPSIRPLNSTLVNRLPEEAINVKGDLFARYTGTRSVWRLSDRMDQAADGWIFVLLEWWAAATPLCLRDYRSAIVALKRTMLGKEIVQSGLRGVVRGD